MRFWAIVFIFMITTGCAKVVDDFVTGGDPATPTGPVFDDEDEDTSNQLKLSPGMVRTTSSTGVNMTARITHTRHTMTSANVSAVIGLHKSR